MLSWVILSKSVFLLVDADVLVHSTKLHLQTVANNLKDSKDRQGTDNADYKL